MKAADPTTFSLTVHSTAPVLENALNRMCNSLESSENRKRFKAFPEAYCHSYGLTREETHAVTDLDVHRMLQLGGHIQRLALLTSIYGMDVLSIGAEQHGLDIEEFHALLVREGYISAH